MRRYITLIFLSLLSFGSFTQENTSGQKLDRTIVEWTPLKSFDNVLIEYRFITCEATVGYDKEIIQLRITNTTSENIELSWHMYLYYNGICKTCDYPYEYKYSLSLTPNQVLSGDCALDSDHQLKIFSKFSDPAYKGGSQLTDFELHDLKIITIK
jgi:hypothetical protein